MKCKLNIVHFSCCISDTPIFQDVTKVSYEKVNLRFAMTALINNYN